MTKQRRVFLYVSGDDYSAMDFDRQYIKQMFYEEMVSQGRTKRVIDSDELFAEVEIKEFGPIDDDFLWFVKNVIQDDDLSKQSDFFEVVPV